MKKGKAVTMSDSEERQYHIGLKKGELAGRIMLAGDPDRLDIGRKLFDRIELETQRREFHCITGKAHFLTTYKDSTFNVIHKENYLDFVKK